MTRESQEVVPGKHYFEKAVILYRITAFDAESN